MENQIHALLEQAKKSWKIYKDLQAILASSVMMSSSERENCKIIADNCIQMAAVNWCMVFSTKKKKTYFASCAGINKKVFLENLEIKGISFYDVCDKMRSFRDKYSEQKYTEDEIEDIFEVAMRIVQEYENETRETIKELKLM